MASAAQSRNFLGFGKRKPAPRKKSVAKRSAFGWLTKKKETYHRDVAKERSQLRSAAIEDRRTRVELKKLKAQERAADAAIAQAERRIAAAAKQIDSAKAKQSKGSMSEDRFEAMKARMEGEIEKQKQHKAAILAKNPGCASTLKVKVSDRAKRYRANQPGCKPAGVKKCALCRSKRFLTVDHKDGDESNGRRSNLRWLCKSCNTILGAEMARRGIGRRTEQYNPGAETAAQYARAVAIHESHYVPGVGRIGEHDEGGAIIHDTPKSKRREFASAIWASRKAHGNPTAETRESIEYNLGYSLGQRDRDTATLRRSIGELKANFASKFDPAHAMLGRFTMGYDDGYGLHNNPSPYTPESIVGQRWEYAYQARKRGAWRTLFATSVVVADHGDTVTFADGRTEPNDSLVRPRPLSPESNPEACTPAAKRRLEELIRSDKAHLNPAALSNPNPYDPDLGYDPTLDAYGYPKKKLPASMVKISGQIVSKGTKKHAQLLAMAKHYEDLERRNPSALSTLSTDSEEYSQAKQIAELFHGRPVKEEITLTEQIREHDWLWRIGPLVKLKIRTLTKRSATLPFHQTEEGMVHLFCSPDGKQLYLRGGDQELDLKALDMGEGTEWYRDHMLIGEAKEITYRDKKKFHKFKLVDYFHKLGEVTKKKPMLAYNALAKRLEILGGQYKVETDELVDGMSPGIVN